MAKVDLYPDFKEFLGLLNSAKVEYLILGGYAVIYYGYRRVTDDLDVWVALQSDNVGRVAKVLREYFGYTASALRPFLQAQAGKVFIFGREPVRIDILTGPDGVEFNKCYARRNIVLWDGVRVPLIALEDLATNKLASGRPKDIADLEHLPIPAVRKKAASIKRPPRRK
jgi:hypothetical protein